MALTRKEIAARYRARHLEQERARGRACSKQHHVAHRDEAIAAMKARYVARREEIAAQRKAQRLLNLEAERAKGRARWDRERARISELRKSHRAANPGKARQKDAERRARPGYSEKATARTAEWCRKHPEWARALARKTDAKRRAIEREVFVEAVDPRVVFERDNGRCGICMQLVDVNSQWHVDHIVPISKGGPHSCANVQLAHAKCNRTKGAKLCA